MTMDYGYQAGQTQERRAAHHRSHHLIDAVDVVGFFAGWLVLGGCFLAALTMDGDSIAPAANTVPVTPGPDLWWTSVGAATALCVALTWLLVVYRIWQVRMRAVAVVRDRGAAGRWFLAAACLLAAGLLLAGCVLPPPNEASAPEVPESSESSPAERSAKPAGIPGDGTFEVPGDVKPGTYKSGPAESGDLALCHWSRLKGTSGDFDDIIANGNAQGPVTVTIKKSDRAFETSGCKTWRKVR